MKAGDKVTRQSATLTHEGKNGKPVGTTMTGTVVYVHPKGRFHTVEFQVRGGTVRESFRGAG